MIVEYNGGTYSQGGWDAVTHLVLYDTNDSVMYKTILPVPPKKGSGIVKIHDVFFEPGHNYQLLWKRDINSSTNIAASPVFTCIDSEYFEKLSREINLEYVQALKEAGNSKYYMQLTSGERRVLKKYFNEIDKNGNGSIELLELRNFYLNKFGIDLHETELISMVREADKNDNKRVEFPEFVDICIEGKKNR